jgi:hypothetical protein
MADQLPQPIFTPATKAEKGQHDENVAFDAIAATIGGPLAAQVRDTGRFVSSYETNAQGEAVEIKRPIQELVDPVYKTITDTVLVYVVNDGTDNHEFTNEADALAFERNIG